MSGRKRVASYGRSRGRLSVKSRSRSCPRGMIRRKSYSRRSRSGKRTRVKSACIRDLGKPGRGPKLWTVKKGVLGKYGYKLDKPAITRRNALKRAVKGESYATVIRQLNAVRNYTKLSQPQNSKKYTADMKYLQRTMRSRSRRRVASYGRSRRRK